jgi:hypothetical protein
LQRLPGIRLFGYDDLRERDRQGQCQQANK